MKANQDNKVKFTDKELRYTKGAQCMFKQPFTKIEYELTDSEKKINTMFQTYSKSVSSKNYPAFDFKSLVTDPAVKVPKADITKAMAVTTDYKYTG